MKCEKFKTVLTLEDCTYTSFSGRRRFSRWPVHRDHICTNLLLQKASAVVCDLFVRMQSTAFSSIIMSDIKDDSFTLKSCNVTCSLRPELCDYVSNAEIYVYLEAYHRLLYL